MMKKLTPLAPEILGATRIIAGTMFACHGCQKLFGAFGGPGAGTPTLTRWVAGLVELTGGSLLAVDFFTRGAAFVASGLMAFAYFMVHAPRGLWPIENGGELAILYCWLFLSLAAQGPGAWALGPRGERRTGDRNPEPPDCDDPPGAPQVPPAVC